MGKMIYCFDLDGTLCRTEGSNYENSVPIQERIDIVNHLYDEGHVIYIETARGSFSGVDWHSFTCSQLYEWGIKYNKLRTGTKFHADVFIDDKGLSDKEFFKESK